MRIIWILTGIGIWMLSLISCAGSKSKTGSIPMPSSYEDLWKSVDQKDREGLPLSAVTIVDSIAYMAKKEANAVQQIKTLIYQAKYRSQLDEAGLKKGIELFEADLKSTSDPIVKSLIHSLQAQLYQQYFDQNRWLIRSRTTVHDAQDINIESWSPIDFLRKIRFHYIASFQEKALKAAGIQEYKLLLTEGKGADTVRPFLYDILAHRALDYFMNTRSDLDLIHDDFVFDQPILFAPTDQFIGIKTFSTVDSMSFHRTVMQLFQDLESFHQKDMVPNALIDVVQKRLQFVYENYSGAEKEKWYVAALDQKINQYKSMRWSAPFLLRKAMLFIDLGQRYEAGQPDTTYHGYLIKSVEILKIIIQEYKGTSEANQAENLLNSLLQTNLEAQAEIVNLPDKPFRILLTYRNATKIFASVYLIDQTMRQKLSRIPTVDAVAQIAKLNVVQSSQHTLPPTSDLQSHKVELKMSELTPGMYAIILSSSENFKVGEHEIALLYTHVSNIAYFHSFNQYHYASASRIQTASELYIVDRHLGSPMVDVQATFYENQYEPSTQSYKWVKINDKKSDIHGRIVPELPKNKNFSVHLSKGKDQLWLDEGFSNTSYYQEQLRETTDILFFLDRSIYRPGQTIYFKALAMVRDAKRNPRILSGNKIDLTLTDANGQALSTKSFTSNEYGTFHGSFVAPTNGLMGSMSLISNMNQASIQFQVEEYKRPKFEVQFDTNKIINRLNEVVSISGLAKNYAGNVVDQAKVKYKVTRKRYYQPVPWWGWKGLYPHHSEPKIIAQGVSNTSTDGKFNIPFTALPEPNIDLAKDDVSFVYTVEVDITDFTGETRSATASYRIGTKNLILGSILNQTEHTDSLKEILILATDLNGVPVQSQGSLVLYKLKEPSRHYRSRYWEQPDLFLYTEMEYHKWFPTDPYKDEQLIHTWPVASTVFTVDYTTQRAYKLSNKLEPGIYKLVATSNDKNQSKATYENYFWVEDPAKGLFKSIEPLRLHQSASIVEPGQEIQTILRTLSNPQYVLLSSSRSDRSEWLVNNGLTRDQLKLTEKDRGTTHQDLYFMIEDNRVYSSQMAYGIAHNKDLLIQTISFRDKLAPGQAEEWTLKISGTHKDKLVAEVVAGMYDQSLDALYPHEWRRDLYHMNYESIVRYLAAGFSTTGSIFLNGQQNIYKEIESTEYRNLNWFGFEIYGNMIYDTRGGRVMKSQNAMPQADGMANAEAKLATPPSVQRDEEVKEENDVKDGNQATSSVPPLRKNLKETVFFYPDLKTDQEGNILLKFKMNEALTRWRLMVFGHTTDLKSGYLEQTVVTQKELMVFPNAPRFVRHGDRLEFPAKVSNLSKKQITGQARLELFDPMNGKNLNTSFAVSAGKATFTIPIGQSSPLSWTLLVPDDYLGMLGYRVIAESEAMTDGEENVMPVLTNRMLVTETMPFQVKSNQSKSFVFNELISKSTSKTLKHQAFTLECTTNPAWYAIQALPYMMEYPHECTEQLVNRLYANSLAATIIQSNPHIKTVFDAWNRSGDLKSPLSKNQELKAAVLDETPWVRESLNEEEQQKMIALLFDLNKIANEKIQVMQILRQRQLSNGGFPWFDGRDDWYITQYILESLGHLKKLGALQNELDDVIQKAVLYCDRELIKHFEELKKIAKKEDIGLNEIAIHYLYMRSFYNSIEIENKIAFNYFLKTSERDWLKQSLYSQGMIALALHRWTAESKTPLKILASLSEKAQHHDELGMYWKFDQGYRWFELPIETQALLVEAYAEIKPGHDQEVDDMRIWLLKNKQTNRWSSTKSTAAAIYALMLQGKSWISESNLPDVMWGADKVVVAKDKVVPGLGYFKIVKAASAINTSLANLQVKNPNNHILWGALYWQYFEDLEKITSFKSTPLTINKKLYLEKTDGNTLSLRPFSELIVGEKLIVRIEIKVDRPMDYVHLKDMRAAGLEPINAISQYKMQGGLGYYESTKDLATHFFIDHIAPGTYVLEYPLRVTQRGMFSNGISSMECMYAPEFSTHSKGEVITIK